MWRFDGWLGRLLYRLEWVFNQRLLILPSHASCGLCQWVFHRSKLNSDGFCPGCAAWTEEEARREQEYAEAREAYERDLEVEEHRRQEEINQACRQRRR